MGEYIYVGATDGHVRAFSSRDLSLAGELDVKVRILGHLILYGGALVFPGENRHVFGVSRNLKLLFDWAAPNPRSKYLAVNGKLIRSSPFVGFVKVAVLDLEEQGFGPEKKVSCTFNTPVVHNGRLYYPNGGGSVSYDGFSVEEHSGKLGIREYRINQSSDYPVAYGTGGVYEVNEQMRPVRCLVPRKLALAAAVNKEIIAALVSKVEKGAPDVLQAWKESGEQLALNYTTSRYNSHPRSAPILVPFENGFLFVGREILYVDPHKEKPVWRFWPGGLSHESSSTFRRPVICGGFVYVTHCSGQLYMFIKSRILGADHVQKNPDEE